MPEPRSPLLPALLLLALVVTGIPAAAQVTRFQGPEDIPGLTITVEPAALALAPGETANLTASVRNDGNETLDLVAEVFVHDPARRGSGGGNVMIGGPGAPRDDTFEATLSNASLRLAPGDAVQLVLAVRAAADARNGTEKVATLHLRDQASPQPEGPPPRAELVDIPLRVLGAEPAGDDASPTASEPGLQGTTPAPERRGEEDDGRAVPGAGWPALVLVGSAAGLALRRRRRNGKP